MDIEYIEEVLEERTKGLAGGRWGWVSDVSGEVLACFSPDEILRFSFGGHGGRHDTLRVLLVTDRQFILVDADDKEASNIPFKAVNEMTASEETYKESNWTGVSFFIDSRSREGIRIKVEKDRTVQTCLEYVEERISCPINFTVRGG